MATSPLASLLIGSGAVARDRLAEAQRRRTIYGGALDTVLLEMGAIDERTLTVHLAESSGLPAPLPERLASPELETRTLLPASDARRLLAAPFALREGVLELALHPEANPDAIAAWADTTGVIIECFVVLEVRFREFLAVLYGDVLPQRFVAILGRLMGADRTRQRAGPAIPATAPSRPTVDTAAMRPPRPTPAPVVAPRAVPAPVVAAKAAPAPVAAPSPPESEADFEIIEDESPSEPLGPLLDAAGLEHAGMANAAFAALAERREPQAVPILIDRLGDREVAATAHEALVTLTRQDFGKTPRAWLNWWQKARDRSRAEWLFEALAHKRSDLRLAASEELRTMTGVYFGYHFDLPERDREEARRRWSHWWHTAGKSRAGERAR